MNNTFEARQTLTVGEKQYAYFQLEALSRQGVNLERLPYSLRILLENLLRHEDGRNVTADDVLAVARWTPNTTSERDVAYMPARILLQDCNGVPAIANISAMREILAAAGGDPARINPALPVELVIDHAVQVDVFGNSDAVRLNIEREYERNHERYAFMKWGGTAIENFKVVPPNVGIIHQVNLERLAPVVFVGPGDTAYPDTLVGTDSHTTMINGLGVLGWGVGSIEAESIMLGQPITMPIPQVVGVRLTGKLPEGATATDLVLTVTERLRKQGVVGKFVEFCGPGLQWLPLADRATLANMAPDYGATCGFFPVDAETLRYLRVSGRSEEQIALVEAYMKAQGLFHTAASPEPCYSEIVELDMNTVEPVIAGPRRPQDRIPLSRAAEAFEEALPALLGPAATATQESVVPVEIEGEAYTLAHGFVAVAAITSCTNTSNPAVMIAAGLLAQKAVERGLQSQPWVKTSLAPGSRVVTEYLDRAGLTPAFEALRFHTVGYGCMTCIGNSGPLHTEVSRAILDENLVACSVLSGNRNFDGRIHSEVRANYLMSPPLVVAYALAGRLDWNPNTDPIGTDKEGKAVYLRDLWPTQAEVSEAVERCVTADMFRRVYAHVFEGDEHWNALEVPASRTFPWDEDSTYTARPPFFDGMLAETPADTPELCGARALALLGDSITTDHISPAGAISAASPSGQWLLAHGVTRDQFNTFLTRRGHHEVMVRGAFGNLRLKNRLAPGIEGGFTTYLPTGEITTIYDAAMRYKASGTPLIILAGKEYGTGSSRDWAAKGPLLLGVRAILAQSFERIHRTNLVGMGILPLQFLPDQNADTLGLTGEETFETIGLTALLANEFSAGNRVMVRATAPTGKVTEFEAILRIDTACEADYYRSGGILRFVLHRLLKAAA